MPSGGRRRRNAQPRRKRISGWRTNPRLNTVLNAGRNLERKAVNEKRLVNSEFNQLKRFSAFLSELNYFRDELKDRWKMVENGEERITKCIDESMELFEAMMDTVPANQLKSLRNAMLDYRITFVPKTSPDSRQIVMDKEHAKALIDLAQEECKICVKTPEEAENCPIFRLSTGVVPPDTYDSLICPYSQAEWAD